MINERYNQGIFYDYMVMQWYLFHRCVPIYDLSNECKDQMIKPTMYEDVETINFLAN